MRNLLKAFHDDESGAVTVDWVVLTGGVLIFGILVVASIASGANHTASGAGARLATAAVPQISWE